MISKMVTDRLKAAESVIAAVDHAAPKLSEQAAATFAPFVRKGETMPDWGLVALLVKRSLEERATQMSRADSAHNDELADDADPRNRRDAATQAVYAALVEIKEAVVPLFGAAWLPKLKLPAAVPQDAPTLARLAPEVHAAIAGAKLPKPKLPGVKSFDRLPWLTLLDAPTKELQQALKDVAREAREAQATVIAKNRAVAAYDETFSKACALGAALLRLVGEGELADRLRPSARTPGTLETEDQPAPGEPPADPDEPTLPGGPLATPT